MMKKDYFVRSCIYNRICVVGKKETIYPLVEVLRKLYLQLYTMHTAFINDTKATFPTSEEISALQSEYEIVLKAIIDMLDGAKYLWKGERHE